MESKPEQAADAKSTKSVAKSVAKSTVSMTASERMAAEERERHEQNLKAIREKYVSIIDKDQSKYHSKMVGLNPNMRPTANQSLNKIFPMQGLWTSKQLMVSTRDTYAVSKDEQEDECKNRNKLHFKKMYK